MALFGKREIVFKTTGDKERWKKAKEAGVSTEGSTLDILERINHANVVKQAKEAGVSTEGSTLDILERINRKALEDYLK